MQGQRSQHTGRQIIAGADDAGIGFGGAELFEGLDLRAVADGGTGDVRRDPVDVVLPEVQRDHVVAVLIEGLGQRGAEVAETDDDIPFHGLRKGFED